MKDIEGIDESVPISPEPAYRAIRKLVGVINLEYLGDSTRSHCKQELYHLQCWLSDEYKKLPVFVGEEKWEQDRIVKILKD